MVFHSMTRIPILHASGQFGAFFVRSVGLLEQYEQKRTKTPSSDSLFYEYAWRSHNSWCGTVAGEVFEIIQSYHCFFGSLFCLLFVCRKASEESYIGVTWILFWAGSHLHSRNQTKALNSLIPFVPQESQKVGARLWRYPPVIYINDPSRCFDRKHIHIIRRMVQVRITKAKVQNDR